MSGGNRIREFKLVKNMQINDSIENYMSSLFPPNAEKVQNMPYFIEPSKKFYCLKVISILKCESHSFNEI